MHIRSGHVYELATHLHYALEQTGHLSKHRCLATSVILKYLLDPFSNVEVKFFQGSTTVATTGFETLIKALPEGYIPPKSELDQLKDQYQARVVQVKANERITVEGVPFENALFGHVALLLRVKMNNASDYWLLDPTAFQFRRTEGIVIAMPDILILPISKQEFINPTSIRQRHRELGVRVEYDYAPLDKFSEHPHMLEPTRYKATIDAVTPLLKRLKVA